MPLKPVYSIEIDDTKFKEFKKLFDRYQSELAKLPKFWNDVNSKIAGAGTSFGNMADEANRQNERSRQQEDSTKRTTTAARATAIVWSSITTAVSSVENKLSSATSHLRKWSTYAAAFTGLLGAGGLWGIGKLADSVSAQRRSAMGLGISYGQQSSLKTNYGRLIDAGSLLSNVSTAKYDLTSPQYLALLAAGISSQAINAGNAATLSGDYLSRLPAMFGDVKDPLNRGQVGAKARAYKVDQMMSLPDLMAFLDATPEERKRIAERNAQDALTQDLTAKAQEAWQDFTTQMGRASGKIEATFAEKLAIVEPGLEHLSNVIVDKIKEFGDTGLFKQWMTGFGQGLESLAATISDQGFEGKVLRLANWIGDAARDIWKWISGFAQATGTPMPTGSPGGVGAGGIVNEPSIAARGAGGAPIVSGASPGSSTFTEHEAYIRQRAAQLGVDPDFAVAVARAEGMNRYAMGANEASRVDIDPVTGQPFSFGDFQLNVRNGLGVVARHAGIDPADASTWKEQDDFVLRHMATGDFSPWKGDRAVEAYRRAGRLPSVIIQRNTGNNAVLSGALVATPSTAVAQ